MDFAGQGVLKDFVQDRKERRGEGGVGDGMAVSNGIEEERGRGDQEGVRGRILVERDGSADEAYERVP